MVALNGVLGASNVGNWLTRLCSVPSALGISPGLARKASVMAFMICGAASHIFSCWRIMLLMMSAMPFTGSTAVGELGAGLATAGFDRGVMDLGVENALAVGQPGDDVELPERTAAIERVGMQPGDHLLELGLAARRRQRRLTQVIVEVEIGIVDPAGMIEVVERRRQPLGEDRDGVQPAFEKAAGVPVETALEAFGKLKVGEPRHVHGGLGRLEIEERRVDA